MPFSNKTISCHSSPRCRPTVLSRTRARASYTESEMEIKNRSAISVHRKSTVIALLLRLLIVLWLLVDILE